ncbi:hypothetical protein ELQ92_05935 [Labedella populi]|uniref:DUF3558 domain-containing protein n=1 Tax=Labedella populi TaxID=2498850 RepID=A0A444QCA5_9MICO|nr:hypothetical protein [Labedella populi]RWZ64305.1 hypothetical protein ELQ92_05935 [Labedella populi]
MTQPDVAGEHRDSSPVEPDGDREAPPPRSRLWIGSAIAIAAVLALLAGSVFALLTHMGGAGMANPTRPDTGTAGGDGSRPVPAETVEPAIAAPRPTDCEQIYSPDMYDYLESTGLPLNDGSVTDSLGATDPVLAALITDGNTVKCSWGFAGEYGLNTNITQVDEGTAAAVLEQLDALAFECYDESEGRRCIQSDTVTDDLGTYRTGESHFVRGGVWIATHWVNFAPDRYTQDIVESLWPASE